MIKEFFKRIGAATLMVLFVFGILIQPLSISAQINIDDLTDEEFDALVDEAGREIEAEENQSLYYSDEYKQELINEQLQAAEETLRPYPTQDRKDILDESEITETPIDEGIKTSGKFLWKPVAENGGPLVILYDSTLDANIFIPNGSGGYSYYETCRSTGPYITDSGSVGYLSVSRCSKHGEEYPNGTIVKIGTTEIEIPNTAERLETTAEFASASIQDFYNQEGEEGYGTSDILMDIGGVGVTCAMETLLTGLLSSKLGEFAGALEGSFLSLAVPTIDLNFKAKETGGAIPSYDSIAYCMMNALIIGLSESTIDWINGGFEGNPVFVDDPSKFFQDIADREISIFLTELGDGFLCKEFNLDVQLAIINQQTKREGGWCTLDRARANVERTLSGEGFSFEVYDEIIKNPGNTPVGAFLIVDRETKANIYEEASELHQELEWGNGYFSWKTCEEQQGPLQEGEARIGPAQEGVTRLDPICKTVTPGHIVASKTVGRLGLAEERLVLADEFNEILTALVNQLIKIGAQEILGS